MPAASGGEGGAEGGDAAGDRPPQRGRSGPKRSMSAGAALMQRLRGGSGGSQPTLEAMGDLAAAEPPRRASDPTGEV